MLPLIPLDVIVLIAKYCIKEDWKMILTFASCCKKLYNKPYIKTEYLKSKRKILRDFLIKMIDVFDPLSYIILNINGCEKKITSNTARFFFEYRKQSRVFIFDNLTTNTFNDFRFNKKHKHWYIDIDVRDKIENLDAPFLYISTLKEQNRHNQVKKYKVIKEFSWTELNGIIRINITY